MAELVSAIAMTHNPRIFWNADAASEEDRTETAAAFEAARKVVEASAPDVILAVGNDHLDQFPLGSMPAFAVGCGSEVIGPFWYEEEVMHLPRYRAPSHRPLAEDLLFAGSESGLNPQRCEEYRIDHAFTVPLSTVAPGAVAPVVPVFTNCFGPPMPRSMNCFRFGELIAEVVASRPVGERIALVGSFNLSVDVGGPRMGERHLDFDEQLLTWIAGGDVEHLTDGLDPENLVTHGNSTAEFLNYQTMLGLVRDRKPDSVWYRRSDAWGGIPVVSWTF
jgi:protocatechuate 4,5-dioxygenase, beta chain